MKSDNIPQFLNPTAGEPHQSRFARCLVLFNEMDACPALRAGYLEHVDRIRTAVATCAAIEWLRSCEGDTVQILCDNPDPDGRDDQAAVICCGGWTNYQDERFNGDSVLAALDRACRAREGREAAK